MVRGGIMTELAIRDEPESGLVLWAEEARAAASIAVSLAKTAFVPQSLRGQSPDVTAAQITAAILAGREVGLQPMAALRSIDIIQGTPAMRAVALRALTQAAGHEVWVDSVTDEKAVVKGKRLGSDHEQSSTWTMTRARNLNLANKDNWKKQPQAMLVARATSEVCRLIASDVLLGMPYSIEELQDLDEVEAPRSRKVKRQPLAAVIRETTEPELEPSEPAEPAAEIEASVTAEPDFDPETGEQIPEGALV
jgi:hypothetical protein